MAPSVQTALLLLNTCTELIAVLSCFGILLPGAPTPSMRDYHNSPVEQELIAKIVGPNAMGLCAFLSLAAVLTRESNSKAVWIALTYYHASTGLTMANQLRTGKHTLLTNDPAAAVFHVVAVGACLAALVLSSRRPSGKKSKSL
jgi:hypothetical protein